MKTLLKEFKEFAVKGNVVDMAVGVIVGGAFGKIVTSLVNDVIMPLVGVLTGGIDFSNLFLPLDGNTYATLAEAEAAGAAVLKYGLVPLAGARFSDRFVRDLYFCKEDHGARPEEGSSRGGSAENEGLPLLQERDRHRRHTLPALHLGAPLNRLNYVLEVCHADI